MSDILIVKASGELDVFDPSKLRHSLRRSGASDRTIEDVVTQVQASLHEGITTKEIYKTAFSLLKQESRPVAARYSLKNAIYELGPTGFPFERFVGHLLSHQGFTTHVGEIVQGDCVAHEVDVVAIKDNERYLIECKFHARGHTCNVKVPLYVKSRFDDVSAQWRKTDEGEPDIHQCWIVTNTRFTLDAIDFGTCTGMVLLGWDYPHKGSLKERIDVSGLHPVTCLTSMSKHEKGRLLGTDIVLVRELVENPTVLSQIGIGTARERRILDEAERLYTGQNGV